MEIRVKGYLTLQEALGDQVFQESGFQKVTLKDLLKKLSARIVDQGEVIFDPESGEVSQHIRILVNGCHHTHLPDKLETELKDGDEVAIFPPMAGG